MFETTVSDSKDEDVVLQEALAASVATAAPATPAATSLTASEAEVDFNEDVR